MPRVSAGQSAGMDITVIGKRVQRWAGAPAVFVGRWGVLWPAPSAYGDLSWRLLGGDEVVQHKTKVGLEDEEDLDEMGEARPASGGGPTESVDYCRGHGGGEKRKGVNGFQEIACFYRDVGNHLNGSSFSNSSQSGDTN